MAGYRRAQRPAVARPGLDVAAVCMETAKGMRFAMSNVTIFWLQLCLSCVVCAVIVAWYVLPYLSRLPRNAALIPLLFVHVPRYIGMTLLVGGMIDPKLPRDFLATTAYGDLLAALLALASIIALRGNWRGAVVLAWVANTWGFADLLNALSSVLRVNVPSFDLRTTWYIYTFYAPAVVASHLLIFWVLMKPKASKQQPL